VRVGGLVSGLDVDNLVTQLIALESRPLYQLRDQQTAYEVKIKAWEEIDAKLQALFDRFDEFDAQSLEVHKVELTDSEVLSAAADASATAGTYSLSVTQLAQAHRVASAAVDTSYTVSAGAAGTISVTVTDETGATPTTTDVVITEGMTLAQVATAINDQQTGVTASIIDYHLVLSRNETGINSQIELSDTAGGLLTTELGLLNADGTFQHELVAPQDAQFSIDGLTVTRHSNTVSDAIGGITLTLKQETTTPVEMTVSTDSEAVLEGINELIDSYNAAVKILDTEVSKGGRLRGESMLISLRSRLRQALSDAVAGATSDYDRLAAVGVTTNRDGTLELDEDELLAALADDPDGLQYLFLDESDGIKVRLDSILDPYLEVNGLLDSHRDHYEGEIDRLQDRMERLEDRLELRRKHLYQKYTEMERMLSNLQMQSNWLAAQISSIYMQ